MARKHTAEGYPLTTRAMKTRDARRQALVDLCAQADAKVQDAHDAIRLRNKSMDQWQGPVSDGGFTYTELANITRMSRSRVNQIISGRRKANA